MALLLPLTFGMSIDAGLLMLAGVFCGAVYGGSISAILVGIPGTAASIPTAFDGFPMARAGKAREAMLYSLYASGIGGLASALVLITLTPVIAIWALRFGPPEMFALTLWGISMVSSVVGKDAIKGLIMAVVGLVVSTVGADPVNGYIRLTFGNYYFIGGIDFVPLILGALALPRVLEMIEDLRTRNVFYAESTSRKWYLAPGEILRYWGTIVKSSIIGIIIGIAPAAGPSMAAYMSYNEAKRSSAHPERFGSGEPDGLVASETGNNAATGGDLVLTLALGIPGSAAAAVLLGALIMKGIQPGPHLMHKNPQIVYTFFAGFFLVNILFFLLGHLVVQVGHYIVRTPLQVLAPTILVICVVGAYSSANSMMNVAVMVITGVIAYCLGKAGFPMAPFLLALILGPIMEASYWTSLLIAYGDVLVFFKRPLSVAFMVLAVVTLLAPCYGTIRQRLGRIGKPA